MVLFEQDRFLQYRFPEPQYLGSKSGLISWIAGFIPEGIHSALDAFAGSQSVAFYLKQRGLSVYTNDFLAFNHVIGKALIENQRVQLPRSLAEDLLFQPNPRKQDYTLMEELYADLFFLPEQARFLDNFRANVDQLSDPYQQSLALTVMNRSITRKITMGHFAHTQALVYAADRQRLRRNPSLAKPLADLFLEQLPLYNRAVFDNDTSNFSYRTDTLELLPKLLATTSIDLAYFDPPYCNSHADYQSFYHLTETYTEYWRDKQFVNSIRRYEPQRVSGFDKKSQIIDSLKMLFRRSEAIPYWLVSYNDRSYPGVDELTELLRQFRKVNVQEKPYLSSRGGKGSVAGSREILFVCEPKRKTHRAYSDALFALN